MRKKNNVLSFIKVSFYKILEFKFIYQHSNHILFQNSSSNQQSLFKILKYLSCARDMVEKLNSIDMTNLLYSFTVFKLTYIQNEKSTEIFSYRKHVTRI